MLAGGDGGLCSWRSWASGKKPKGLFPAVWVLGAPFRKEIVRQTSLEEPLQFLPWDSYLVWNGGGARRDGKDGAAQGLR